MTGTQHEDQPNRINPIAIIAGALASLSAAVVASYFGVAGTLIGAAVVSLVSSLAAALYAGLLGRGRGLVQHTATTVLHASDRTGRHSTHDRPAAGPPEDAAEASAPGSGEGPAGGRTSAPGSGEGRTLAPGSAETSAETSAGGPAPTTASGTAASPSGGSPRAGGRIGWPWRRSVVVIGAAALIFAIAIGAVSGIEAAIKEPISTALGARDKGQARTSVGVAMDRAGGSPTTRQRTPSSSTQTPPTSGQQGQAPSTTGAAPSTTEPGPPSTGGQPPSTTLPPRTSQPSSPGSSSGATPGG
ncbi:MAG TPA: hypothetical protein VGC06_22010 [Actinomycetes bacterium]